ncbi:MAG TPA: tetratricopeptide repeat protein [Ktedonobacteraceae bacterium]|nr:tetratricopeptide repeat protein [Ktedonobacteraceae bacterium]
MYTDLLDKGYASLRRGDPDAALIRFRHAAESEPERPQAYFGIAMVYLEQDSSDETVNALETALSVDPFYIPARAYLGIEYLKRYDVVRAEEELARALKDEPTNLLAHLKYAEFYYRMGFYNRSVEILERGLKGPHGSNEHVVAMARQLLVQARQKSKNIVLRELPDPRRWLRLFARFMPRKGDETTGTGQVEMR